MVATVCVARPTLRAELNPNRTLLRLLRLVDEFRTVLLGVDEGTSALRPAQFPDVWIRRGHLPLGLRNRPNRIPPGRTPLLREDSVGECQRKNLDSHPWVREVDADDDIDCVADDLLGVEHNLDVCLFVRSGSFLLNLER